jgi:hypothetical protein
LVDLSEDAVKMLGKDEIRQKVHAANGPEVDESEEK